MKEDERTIQAYKTELEYNEEYIKVLKEKVNKLQKEVEQQKEILDILKSGYMWVNNYYDFKKIKIWLGNGEDE